MLLKKLSLTNYKTYYGIQEIDMYIPPEVREKNQNIILVGGLNGAGKTTILKAILYILFGERGISKNEYKRLFSNVINNTFFEEGGRECNISLSLETDNQEEWTLKINWYFDNLKRMTLEQRSLEVRKIGSTHAKKVKIDNIEAYNKFIDRVIPYYAAPFFIFDGEEIKDIILRQNSSEMKEAIHKITGMDAYNQLLLDLKSLKSTLDNKLAKSISQTKLKNAKEELEEITATITTLETKQEELAAIIRKLNTSIQKEKQSREQKIIKNSKSREVLVKEQSRLTTELAHAKRDLDTFFKQNILTIILANKISKLKSQLKVEQEIAHNQILQEASLAPYQNFMKQLLSKSIEPPLTSEQLKQIQSLGEEVWIKNNNIKITVPDEFTEIHDISNKDYNYLLNIPIKDKKQFTDLINKIEKLQQKLEASELEIRKAPESVDISNENKKIDNYTQTLGKHTSTLNKIRKRLSQAYAEKTEITNLITRMANQDGSLEDIQTQSIQVQKAINAMEQYITEMTIMKATFIKEEFSNMLQKLFRKQDEFGKIEFDINSYSIRLYNDRMQEISIQDRSAGEMQMISSALIWALTKASDLSLPVVIDTPLGRLDSYHRNHLINHYYKELSNQVIILSTDTEITQEYEKLMEKNSYKQYMLDYDEKKKYTIIRDGYFEFVKG